MTLDNFFIKRTPMLGFFLSPLEKFLGGVRIIFAVGIHNSRRRNTENEFFRSGLI